jgi:hypothetical protein
MPKKSKTGKSTKATGKQAKRSKKKQLRPAETLRTIKVHPHLAHAIQSLKKFSPEELEQVKNLSRATVAEAGQSTGCWISDSGGQQHCVNLPPDVCTRQGGISVPTRCPNT